MFDWFARRRRQKIMESFFSPGWQNIIRHNMVHYRTLDDAQRRHQHNLELLLCYNI